MKLFITVFLFFVSCAAKPRPQDAKAVTEADYRPLIESRLKGNIEYLMNDSKTHVLAIARSKPTAEFPQRSIHYALFDVSASKIVLEESIIDGRIRWIDNDNIEITLLTEVAKKDETANKVTTILNIHSLTKTNPSTNQN